MKEFDDAFALAQGEGGAELLDKDQLRVFIVKMNQNAVEAGQAGRETTDEYVDMCWLAFNGYDLNTDGVSKDDITYVLRYCTF